MPQYLLLIQVVSFISLVGVMWMFFHRQQFIAARRLTLLHEENLRKESELKKEIEATRQLRDAELAKAREEAAAMLQEAREKAGRVAKEMQAETAEKIQYALQQNEVKMRVLAEELANRHSAEVLATALDIFRVILTSTGKENFQHMLVDELIDDMAELDDSLFSGCETATVTAACPLNEEEMRRLRELFAGKTGGKQVAFSQTTDEGLIAGMVIQAGIQIFDGSLKNKLEKVVALLQTRTNGKP